MNKSTTLFLLGFALLGCQEKPTAAPAAPTASVAASASTSPSAEALGSEPQKGRRTRFKVTGVKPAEVEAALQHGWTLVNCSVAALHHANWRGSIIEHCYFIGSDSDIKDVAPVAAPDAGAPDVAVDAGALEK